MIKQKQIDGIVTLKVSLTAAQIQSANSSPIDIGLPPSGAGFYYRVTAFDCRLVFGTVPFTSSALSIISASVIVSGGAQISWGVVSGTENIFSRGLQEPAQFPTSLAENDTLAIMADADSLVGDSTIDCYITVERVAV